VKVKKVKIKTFTIKFSQTQIMYLIPDYMLYKHIILLRSSDDNFNIAIQLILIIRTHQFIMWVHT